MTRQSARDFGDGDVKLWSETSSSIGSLLRLVQVQFETLGPCRTLGLVPRLIYWVHLALVLCHRLREYFWKFYYTTSIEIWSIVAETYSTCLSQEVTLLKFYKIWLDNFLIYFSYYTVLHFVHNFISVYTSHDLFWGSKLMKSMNIFVPICRSPLISYNLNN